MNPTQIKILQTLVFLLDKDTDLILKNNLLPYVKKARELEELLTKK